MPAPTMTLHATDVAATRRIASAIATVLEVGDVVALSGELGAGKTCFVQGAAEALGVQARVTSPTFVLVRQYVGRLPVVHADVYRLDRLHDVHDLGEDVLAPDVVTFLEWADAVSSLLPDERLDVEIVHDEASAGGSGDGATAGGRTEDASATLPDDGARRLTLRLHGARWQQRAQTLATAVTPWHSTG